MITNDISTTKNTIYRSEVLSFNAKLKKIIYCKISLEVYTLPPHTTPHTLHTDFASNIFQCIVNVLHYFFTKKKNKKIKIRIPIKEILRIEVVYSQLTFSLSERKQILKFYKIKPMLMF